MKFLPQNEEFFDLLEQLSQHMVTVSQQLQQLPRQQSNRAELQERIRAEEDAAGELTISELKKLDSAFITPIDREDIMRLMSGLYRIVESMADIAFSFDGPPVEKTNGALQEQFDVLQALVQGTDGLIKPLRDGHKLSDLEDEFRTVRKLKRDADRVRRDALGSVLVQDTQGGLETIKMMHTERLLRAVVDRCDDLRAALQEVILKNS